MRFAAPCLSNEYACVRFFDLVYHFHLMLVLPIYSSSSNLGNRRCSCKQPLKMSEFMTIHPSQFGCIKSAVLTGLKEMYIDGFGPILGIDIKISDVSVGPAVVDPNEGSCSTRCTFLSTRIIPRTRDKLKRSTKKSFHMILLDNTEEKVVVRFEGEKG